MLVVRAVACAAVVAASLASLAPAPAVAADSCAKRVIRDWYAEGRVDGVYPLRCYRAAIELLPEDVVQYSDARDKILRALAYARQGLADRRESADGKARVPPEETGAPARSDRKPEPRANGQTATGQRANGRQATEQEATEQQATGQQATGQQATVGPATGPRDARPPTAFAAPDDAGAADAQGVPYPIVALATLAALLLAAAAAARLGSRRRVRGSPSDR
jgi:hypothetical protein